MSCQVQNCRKCEHIHSCRTNNTDPHPLDGIASVPMTVGQFLLGLLGGAILIIVVVAVAAYK